MHSLPHALLLGAQLWLREASTNGCWAEGAEAQLPRNLEVGCLLGRTSGTSPPNGGHRLPEEPWSAAWHPQVIPGALSYPWTWQGSHGAFGPLSF